jgi:hypothetical protein
MNIFNNRIVQILLIVCVIIGICLISRLNFNFHAGSDGVGMGVDRGK